MDPELGLIFLLLVTSCFYAACEASLRNFSRSRLSERLKGKSDRSLLIVQKTDRLILACGISKSLSNVIIYLVFLNWLGLDALFQSTIDTGQAPTLGERLLKFSIPVVAAVISVSAFSVAIPTSWVKYHSEAILAKLQYVIILTYFVFFPLVVSLTYLDPFIRRLTGGENPTDDDLEENVLSVVEEHEEGGHIDETQKAIIEAVFELPEITAGEIMTPRTDLSAIDEDSDLDQIKCLIMEAGYSRMPVYKENIDQITGILYAKDLMRYLTGDESFDMQACLRKPMMVPETKPVAELMSEFRSEKVHIAVVLDEYGGTAGIITIEDILEELVGEIQDEYEDGNVEPSLSRIDEHTYEMEARLEIDHLNETLNLELPDDQDFETVGGFVFSELGHIPVEGEQLTWRHLQFTVLDAQSNRINRLKLEMLETAHKPEA